jgi:hypothetical protein
MKSVFFKLFDEIGILKKLHYTDHLTSFDTTHHHDELFNFCPV